MTVGEGRKPHIVIGRRSRGASVVLGVLLLHALLLQDASLPRMKPVLVVPVVPVGVHEVHELRAQPSQTATSVEPRHEDAAPPKHASSPAAAPHIESNAPAAATSDGDVDLPVYPTRLPPPLHWRYRFTRGPATGSAELQWRPEADRYEARFTGEADGAPVFEWTSTGRFDSAGVAPERFLDRRRGRGAQAANFRRDSGRITYSGPSAEWPLPPGAQDRLSWLLQLAGIVAAEPGRWQPGQEIRLYVSGAHGDAAVWIFRVEGIERLQALPDEPVVPTLKLVREPSGPFDIRAEVWLDPSRHHVPVRARFANGGVEWRLQLTQELPLP
jgi:hypothetical protein